MKKKYSEDKAQSSIFDFGEEILSKEEKIELSSIPIAHENHMEDSDKFKEEINDDLLRSEQIIISKKNYPAVSDSDSLESIYKSIDNISGYCHKSKNIFDQSLYEIRMAFFGKLDTNPDGKTVC